MDAVWIVTSVCVDGLQLMELVVDVVCRPESQRDALDLAQRRSFASLGNAHRDEREVQFASLQGGDAGVFARRLAALDACAPIFRHLNYSAAATRR